MVKICANVCYRFLFFLFFFPDKFEIDGTTIKDTANFYLWKNVHVSLEILLRDSFSSTISNGWKIERKLNDCVAKTAANRVTQDRWFFWKACFLFESCTFDDN